VFCETEPEVDVLQFRKEKSFHCAGYSYEARINPFPMDISSYNRI
jgi:hypothetical protein